MACSWVPRLLVTVTGAFVCASCVGSQAPSQAHGGRTAPSVVEEHGDRGAAQASEPGPFSWGAAAVRPIRVTPVNHRGQPVPCVAGGVERPCDIEVTGDRQVFYRSFSPAPAGVLGPGLALRRAEGSEAVFVLESDGALVGAGLFRAEGAAQVLFCRLTEEPALRCRHELRASVRDRVWNEESCAESFVAQVEGDAIKVTYSEHPGAPGLLAARIEPPPADDASQALALFVYAMEAVERDTEHHTPHVSDMQVPP